MTLTLDRFFEQVLQTNPFVVHRVAQASVPDADAETVHQAEFLQLTELAGVAHQQRLGIGAVLWGEAGIGKSHLLGRLARWAEPDRACFVYFLNLQAGAEALPRYVLHCIISALTGGRREQLEATSLFRLVYDAARASIQGQPRPISGTQVETAYHRLIDRLIVQDRDRAGLNDRTIYDVLFRFVRSVAIECKTCRDDGVARLALRWLSGEPLDPEDARRLGLALGPRRQEAVALGDDQEVKQVLIALARLAFVGGGRWCSVSIRWITWSGTRSAAWRAFSRACLTAPRTCWW
jgi:hypothetical protein